ncbi:NosD domain-containing protein [Sorangium sp. So ce185]|uniref:NosD domain-containing protein n=1 Tax=Sorangium sp. So ce185 TaxID=3133287 RepID=UPI003F5D7A45
MNTISRFGALCATVWIAACGTEISTGGDPQGPSIPDPPGGASKPDDAPGGTDGSAQGASSALRLRVPGGERVTVDSLVVTSDAPAVLDVESATGPLITLATGDAALASAVALDEGGEVLDASTGTAGCSLPIPGEERVLVVPDAYPSIQTAIDAAAYGDTVFVQPGEYHEHLRLRSGVKLVGAGATTTVLDGEGLSGNLIDYTGAQNAVVRGFRLRNVGSAGDCSRDVLNCSGNWYSAAVYADGHSGDNWEECARPSLLLTQNIIEGNEVGVMLYFHALAVVRNNVFIGNGHGFVGSHLQDHAVVAQNVFYENRDHAIAADAAELDVLNNVIIANGAALEQEHVQRGRVRCNVLFGNERLGNVIVPGQDGNIDADPFFADLLAGDFHLSAGSPALTAGCLGDDGAEPVAAGAHGGALGAW